MAEAGARARAKKWTNEEPEPKINNFGSATLVKTTDRYGSQCLLRLIKYRTVPTTVECPSPPGLGRIQIQIILI